MDLVGDIMVKFRKTVGILELIQFQHRYGFGMNYLSIDEVGKVRDICEIVVFDDGFDEFFKSQFRFAADYEINRGLIEKDIIGITDFRTAPDDAAFGMVFECACESSDDLNVPDVDAETNNVGIFLFDNFEEFVKCVLDREFQDFHRKNGVRFQITDSQVGVDEFGIDCDKDDFQVYHRFYFNRYRHLRHMVFRIMIYYVSGDVANGILQGQFGIPAYWRPTKGNQAIG